MKREQAKVRVLFRELVQSPMEMFPSRRQPLRAPDRHGVYVIYSPRGAVLHVGRTPKAKKGIAQRLRNHLHARSSFTNKYLNGNGEKLRAGY